jgi:hypothetical protein
VAAAPAEMTSAVDVMMIDADPRCTRARDSNDVPLRDDGKASETT